MSAPQFGKTSTAQYGKTTTQHPVTAARFTRKSNEKSSRKERGTLHFGPLVLWSLGPLVPWSFGPLVFWSLGPLVPWSFGPSTINYQPSTPLRSDHIRPYPTISDLQHFCYQLSTINHQLP